MKYCPILSFQADRFCEVGCREERCAFADENGNCLIRQALQCYVSKESTRLADETEVMRTYFKMFKDGRREPITFTNPIVDVKTSEAEVGTGY
jgi:hypothetical protein